MTTPQTQFAAIEPVAYLAVEIKQRELESRLLIACHLLKAGYPVVVGQQWALFENADTLPPGLMLFKTINGIQARNMARFRQFGHVVAATDEEVLICQEDRCFMSGFGATGAENCDLFLAQSEPHKAAIMRRFPSFAGEIAVTGNPRIDLLAPKGRHAFAAEAEALRKEHGPYILFNTNYAAINSVWGGIERIAAIAVGVGALDLSNPEQVREFNAVTEWEKTNCLELAQLMRWAVSTLPDYRLVIRPHPTERKEYWEQQFAGNPRVIVVPRSVPHPWIFGADLICHSACTTGLEAVLMDKPVINLMPTPRPDTDPIVSRVNPHFTDWRSAATAAEAFLRKGSGPLAEGSARYAKTLNEYFPGYQDGDAGGRIAKELVGEFERRGIKPVAPHTLNMRGPGFRQKERPETEKQKITVSLEEVRAMLQPLFQIAGFSGKIGIRAIADSLFLFTPA